MERFSIGRCRSGKIVTTRPELDELVAYDEIFDAMAMLLVLFVREYRRNRESEYADHLLRTMTDLELVLVANEQLAKKIDVINAKTSLDIVRHALRLLRPEFKD